MTDEPIADAVRFLKLALAPGVDVTVTKTLTARPRVGRSADEVELASVYEVKLFRDHDLYAATSGELAGAMRAALLKFAEMTPFVLDRLLEQLMKGWRDREVDSGTT